MVFDILFYEKGNIGIFYIWCFDSGKLGFNVMISVVVYGNEFCGVIVFDWLFNWEVCLVVGMLIFGFMNIVVYQLFDLVDFNVI